MLHSSPPEEDLQTSEAGPHVLPSLLVPRPLGLSFLSIYLENESKPSWGSYDHQRQEVEL